MSAILTNVGLVISEAMEWVKLFVTYIFGGTLGEGSSAVTISANPLLILFIVLPLVGLGVGLFKRLINVN